MKGANEGKVADMRERFQQLYSFLKSELLQDPAFEHDSVSHQWVDRMLDYNVPGGKLNRGLSVVESYMLLKEAEQLPENDFFLACVLGWCIQLVGMVAVNDGVLLWSYINRILRKHFRDQPYYVDLLDLFNEVEFQTACGEMIDLVTTLEEKKDLSKYTPELQRRISLYKTAYGTFYLPFACALLMLGEKPDDYIDAKNALLEMGIYFQVQDDYLDCFGDPEVVGKIGTDIEDFKCSWLVVKALELCNEEQKKLLHENYGKADPAKVAIVKSLYKDLNLEGVYAKYEIDFYEKLSARIEALPSKSVQAVLKSYLGKIHKRHK